MEQHSARSCGIRGTDETFGFEFGVIVRDEGEMTDVSVAFCPRRIAGCDEVAEGDGCVWGCRGGGAGVLEI